MKREPRIITMTDKRLKCSAFLFILTVIIFSAVTLVCAQTEREIEKKISSVESSIKAKGKKCKRLEEKHKKLLAETKKLPDKVVRENAKAGKYKNPIKGIVECELSVREDEFYLDYLRELKAAKMIKDNAKQHCESNYAKKKYENNLEWLKNQKKWAAKIRMCEFQCDENRYLQSQGLEGPIFSSKCSRYVCTEEKEQKYEDKKKFKSNKERIYEAYRTCLKKKKCPKGEAYDGKLGKCRPFCKRNETFDYKLEKCVPKCPKGQIMDDRLGKCREKCTDGKRFDYRQKICRRPCPQGQTFDKNLGKCRIRCSEGEHFDHRMGKCRRLCPPGESFDKRLGKCRLPCSPGEIFDYDKGMCRPHWMERQKWLVIAGKGAGTELEPGDFLEPPKGAGVGIMRIGGPEHGAVFIVWEPTRVPAVVRIPPPEGKNINYMKLLFGTGYSKIKGLLKGNKYCVETENAVASCLGTAYQIISAASGDEITIFEGIVNVLPKKLPEGLISLVAGESIRIDRYGVKKRLISNAEYANLSETFSHMFGSSSEIPEAPESTDTWTPIGRQQQLSEPGSKRRSSDKTGWESLQPQRPFRRQNDSRVFEDEPLTIQEKNSSY